MKNILFVLLAITLMCSCNGGTSKDQLAEKVKADIKMEFTKRSSGTGISFSINSLDLIQKGDNEYSGILKTTEAGQEFTYQVDVTVDGDSYMWKIVE